MLPERGFPLKTLASGGLLGKKGLERIVSWFKLPVGFFQSIFFLIGHRPGLVVGVGGYVSGPLVLAAWLLRIPILIHEQNTIPGLTNTWLGKIADKVAVSFPETKNYFPEGKVVETGNMIREEFCRPGSKEDAGPRDKFNILVLGGSLGAHSINLAMTEALDFLAEVKGSLHIVHQSGERDADWVKTKYAEKGFSAEVSAFIHDMVEQIQKSSLIICRAGATTLAEITACGKPAVLIPYPHAAHNHQVRNARFLVDADAGEMILDPEVSGERLAQSIQRAIEEPERLKEMGAHSYRLGKRDATEKVRELCLQLLNKNRTPGTNSGFTGNYVLSCF